MLKNDRTFLEVGLVFHMAKTRDSQYGTIEQLKFQMGKMSIHRWPNWPVSFPVIYFKKEEIPSQYYFIIRDYAASVYFTILSCVFNMVILPFNKCYDFFIYQYAFYDFLSPLLMIFVFYPPIYNFCLTKEIKKLWIFVYFLLICWFFLRALGFSETGSIGLCTVIYQYMWAYKKVVKYSAPFVAFFNWGRFIFLFRVFFALLRSQPILKDEKPYRISNINKAIALLTIGFIPIEFSKNIKLSFLDAIVSGLLMIFLHDFPFIQSLTGFLILTIELLDACSYITCFEGLNSRTVGALANMRFYLITHKSLLLFAIIFEAFIIFLFFYQSKKGFYISKFYILLCYWVFSCIAFLPMVQHFYIYSSISKTHNKNIQPTYYQAKDIYKFFQSPFNFTAPPLNKMKNLIIFKFEAFELQALGPYSHFPECSNAMPFFTNLSNHSIITENAVQAPFICYSMAGMFTAECGLPILGGRFNARLEQSPYPRCIGNILQKLGYHLEGHLTHDGKYCWQEQFMDLRGYDVKKLHNPYPLGTSDWNLFEYIMENDFPQMAPGKRKKPWALHIESINTHLNDRTNDKRCVGRISPKCNPLIYEFDCEDKLFEIFWEKFYEYHLEENTEVVIYADHNYPGLDYFTPPHKLAFIVPFHGHKKLTRYSDMYDIAPTILDILNITTNPPLLYGNSLLNEKETKNYPSDFDFIILSHIYQQTKQLSSNMDPNTLDYKLTQIDSLNSFNWWTWGKGNNGYMDNPVTTKHILI